MTAAIKVCCAVHVFVDDGDVTLAHDGAPDTLVVSACPAVPKDPPAEMGPLNVVVDLNVLVPVQVFEDEKMLEMLPVEIPTIEAEQEGVVMKS